MRNQRTGTTLASVVAIFIGVIALTALWLSFTMMIWLGVVYAELGVLSPLGFGPSFLVAIATAFMVTPLVGASINKA